MKRWERLLALIALATLVAAFVAGRLRSAADLTPFLQQALPGAERFEAMGPYLFAGQSDEGLAGYAAVGAGQGYGGPMRVAVGMDVSGKIVGTAVVDHKETQAYFRRVLSKTSGDVGVPDAVTGATRTLNAFSGAVEQGARRVKEQALGLVLPPEPAIPLQIGLQEISLLVLFTLGFWGLGTRTRYKTTIRWIYAILGLVLLGFWFNIPLTVVNINSLLLGYWPDWHAHLYWYLLITGVLLAILFFDQSPYCRQLCPFGAAQDCFHAVGRGKVQVKGALFQVLRWVQRLLAWGVIAWALYQQNPGWFTIEVSSTLFDLTGARWQFILLGVVLLASLAMHRPWCNFLCPVRAVTDCLRCVRRWAMEFLQAKP